MDNRKDDKYYIKEVIDNIDIIINYVNNKSYEEFICDELLKDAAMFRLIQMAENINRISKDYKEKHTDVPWTKITGFRNGIVHEYGRTDYNIVYEIISSDIIELKKSLLNIK